MRAALRREARGSDVTIRPVLLQIARSSVTGRVMRARPDREAEPGAPESDVGAPSGDHLGSQLLPSLGPEGLVPRLPNQLVEWALALLHEAAESLSAHRAVMDALLERPLHLVVIASHAEHVQGFLAEGEKSVSSSCDHLALFAKFDFREALYEMCICPGESNIFLSVGRFL